MSIARRFAAILLALLLGSGGAALAQPDEPSPPMRHADPEPSRGVADWAKEQAGRAGEAMGTVKEKLGEAKDQAGPALERAGEKLGQAKDKAVAEAPRVRDGAVSFWEKVKDFASAAAGTVENTFHRIHDGVAEQLKK
jgi:hypothetical protein